MADFTRPHYTLLPNEVQSEIIEPYFTLKYKRTLVSFLHNPRGFFLISLKQTNGVRIIQR